MFLKKNIQLFRARGSGSVAVVVVSRGNFMDDEKPYLLVDW